MLDVENPGRCYRVTFMNNNCVVGFNAQIPAASWEASKVFNIVLLHSGVHPSESGTLSLFLEVDSIILVY